MHGIRSALLVLAGIIVGLAIGSQVRGVVAGSSPCAFPTVTPATFSIKATATPSPKKTNVLLMIDGSGDKQSAIFTAPGAITIHWTTTLADAQIGTEVFNIEINSRSGEFLDQISTQKPGTDSSIEHVDCSNGCYLKITDLWANYKIVVTK